MGVEQGAPGGSVRAHGIDHEIRGRRQWARLAGQRRAARVGEGPGTNEHLEPGGPGRALAMPTTAGCFHEHACPHGASPATAVSELSVPITTRTIDGRSEWSMVAYPRARISASMRRFSTRTSAWRLVTPRTRAASTKASSRYGPSQPRDPAATVMPSLCATVREHLIARLADDADAPVAFLEHGDQPDPAPLGGAQDALDRPRRRHMGLEEASVQIVVVERCVHLGQRVGVGRARRPDGERAPPGERETSRGRARCHVGPSGAQRHHRGPGRRGPGPKVTGVGRRATGSGPGQPSDGPRSLVAPEGAR